MTRSVRFTILRDGTVEAEFTGFPGEECLAEAEALQSVLRKHGLQVTHQNIDMKPPHQILQELGLEDSTATRKQRVKVDHED